MSRFLAISILVISLAVAGCGGGDEDSTSSTTTNSADSSGQTTTQKSSDSKEGGGGGAASDDESGAGGSSSDSGQGQGADGGGADLPPPSSDREVSGAEPADPAEFKVPQGGDDSVQTYGTVAEGEEEEALILAMRSFFTALAESDYPAVCAGLTEANRTSLEAFLKGQAGGCEDVLEKLNVSRVAPEARAAAKGSVFEVRVEDEAAFVLFTPEGGTASFFVLKREGDDEWKSTSLSTGTPFNPTAG